MSSSSTRGDGGGLTRWRVRLGSGSGAGSSTSASGSTLDCEELRKYPGSEGADRDKFDAPRSAASL